MGALPYQLCAAAEPLDARTAAMHDELWALAGAAGRTAGDLEAFADSLSRNLGPMSVVHDINEFLGRYRTRVVRYLNHLFPPLKPLDYDKLIDFYWNENPILPPDMLGEPPST